MVFNSDFDNWISSFLRGDDIQDIKEKFGIIDSENAMKYSAVFACNKVLAETFASMPINIYKKLPNGDRETITDSNIYDVLHNKPNEEMSPFSFKEVNMTNINLGGNAISEKIYSKSGEIIGLYPHSKKIIYIV